MIDITYSVDSLLFYLSYHKQKYHQVELFFTNDPALDHIMAMVETTELTNITIYRE